MLPPDDANDEQRRRAELQAGTIIPAIVIATTGTMIIAWLVVEVREHDSWDRGVAMLRLFTYTSALLACVVFVLSPLLSVLTEDDMMRLMHTSMMYLSGSGFLALADFQGDVTLFMEASVLCATGSIYCFEEWGSPQRPRTFPYGLVVVPLIVQGMIAQRVSEDECIEWNWRRLAGAVMMIASWCFLLYYWENDKGPVDTAWTCSWTVGFWFGLCTLVVFAPGSEVFF
jgi:hypothetical protein